MAFFDSVVTEAISKTVEVRDKLLADIELQKLAVKAKLDGTPFNPKHSDRAFHEWFFERPGAWWTRLKIGHTPILIGGANACKVGPELADLIAWYEKAAEAIKAGELDAAIEEAMGRRKRG